jgi:hypothetical protein
VPGLSCRSPALRAPYSRQDSCRTRVPGPILPVARAPRSVFLTGHYSNSSDLPALIDDIL